MDEVQRDLRFRKAVRNAAAAEQLEDAPLALSVPIEDGQRDVQFREAVRDVNCGLPQLADAALHGQPDDCAHPRGPQQHGGDPDDRIQVLHQRALDDLAHLRGPSQCAHADAALHAPMEGGDGPDRALPALQYKRVRPLVATILFDKDLDIRSMQRWSVTHAHVYALLEARFEDQ